MQELTLSELGGSSWKDPKSASVNPLHSIKCKINKTTGYIKSFK